MAKLKEYKMYINGSWVDAEDKKTFKSLNPENNEPWAIVPEASAKDVDKAVEAAQKAFEGDWPKLLPRERANYLRSIANQLRENSEMLGKIKRGPRKYNVLTLKNDHKKKGRCCTYNSSMHSHTR